MILKIAEKVRVPLLDLPLRQTYIFRVLISNSILTFPFTSPAYNLLLMQNNFRISSSGFSVIDWTKSADVKVHAFNVPSLLQEYKNLSSAAKSKTLTG